MRFELEQRFSAPVSTVEAAFLDPALFSRLASLANLGRPELLEQSHEGDMVHQRVRYTFTGQLSPAVKAVVDPLRLTWVEDSRLDRRTHRSEFTILPDHYADKLRCAGTITLEEVEGATRRVSAGDLKVAMWLVGPAVERAIVSGLREHAVAEAQVVQKWLNGAGTD